MDHIDKNFSSNGKGARQSTTGEHYVVDTKKKRRCACCSRKKCVITSFIILVLLAAGLYFVWPRTPQVQFSTTSQITTDGDATITIQPPVVNMKMSLPFNLDNSDNWLPYKFNSISVNVFDAANIGSFNRPVATGNLNNFKVPGRAKTQISIPVTFDYSGSAPNDPVLQDFIGACTQPPANGDKSTLTLRIDMTMSIMGLDWVKKPTVTIPVQGFQCPFNGTSPSLEPAPTGTDPTTTSPAATSTGVDPAATTPAGGAPAANPAASPTDPAAPPAASPTDPAGAPAAGTAPAADPAAPPAAGPTDPTGAGTPAAGTVPAAGTPVVPVPAAGAPTTDPAGAAVPAQPAADPAATG